MATLDLARDVILRWEDTDPKYIPLLAAGGVTAVLSQKAAPEFAEGCARAGISVSPPDAVRFASLEGLERDAGAPAVLEHGLWPGVARPPESRGSDSEVSSASAQPWIDANMHRIAWLKALYPERPAVLGYLPDARAGVESGRQVPYETLELALVEARAAGGNYVLALDARYRDGLLKGEARALAAWKQFGETARWLGDRRRFLAQPVLPIITTLVEPGEETAEIANLLFRQNASPALAPLASPPPPDPRARAALVAVNLHPGEPASAERILDHARAGSAVVLDDAAPSAWWRRAAEGHLLEEHDRDFFRAGQGRLVVYKERIIDPSDFALDVIDVVTHARRAVRLWNTNTAIAVMHAPPPEEAPGVAACMVVVNYGSPAGAGILVRVHGHYASATLLQPEAGPVPLKTARRGSLTEITIPELRRTAIVVFRSI